MVMHPRQRSSRSALFERSIEAPSLRHKQNLEFFLQKENNPINKKHEQPAQRKQKQPPFVSFCYHQLTQELAEAFCVLSDSTQRKQYDQEGSGWFCMWRCFFSLKPQATTLHKKIKHCVLGRISRICLGNMKGKHSTNRGIINLSSFSKIRQGLF